MRVFGLLLAGATKPGLAQTELIVNGGFESGSTGWNLSGGAQASSYAGLAHSGSYYLWLGGAVNESDAAYQTITIPGTATAATLSFYYNINSLEGNTVAYDTFSATIRNSSGSILATVGNWSNINQDAGPGNPYYHQLTFNLLPYAGQTIRIYFSSVNDSTKVTNFRVDDVSVQVTIPTTYTISVSASPSAGGIVTGGGTFAAGSSQTVSATPNSGYTFANWTENGSVVSPSASYTFTLNGNRNLVANFTLNTYTIAVSASPSAGGIVTGGGTFAAGTSQTVSATPNSGYTFVNWTENGSVVSPSANYTFTLNGNRNLVANFTLGTYTIAVSASPSAGGVVTGGGTFAAGSSQTVSATPNSGYTFANWTENGSVVSPSASYTFTLNGNRNLVANFTLNTYTIAVSASPSAGGIVTGGGTFAAGSSQTVTATPNSGYTFANWTENGSVVSPSASYTFTLNGNRNLVANFTLNTYTIAVSASPSAGGIVTGGGTFAAGSSQTVTAAPNSGYTFANWTENGSVVSPSANYTFTLNGNRNLVANFTLGTYTIAVSASPSAGGIVTGGGTFAAGSSQTVTATPNSGYTFANWTENGSVVSPSASYTFTLNGNRNLVANFTLGTYTIAVSASPSAGGIVTGGGTFAAGSSQTVTAAPNSGYTFANWTENGSVVSPSANYTFTLNGNRNLVANFTLGTYTIAVSASPSAGGIATGGGTFAAGSSQTVTATPNSGYTFANWTENGSVVSPSANYTFTLNGNRNLVANFTLGTYTIAVSASPSAGGVVTGGGTFAAGSSQTVTATPNSGYTFANWMENGSVVSPSASYTFTLNGNRNLVANFTLGTYTIAVSASPSAGGIVTGGGTFAAGSSQTVTATPNSGYTFANWTENGSVVSPSANYTFTLNGNRNLVANFTLGTYTIAVSASPSAGGVVTGGGTFAAGSSQTATATPNSGYTFANWTENGSVVSPSASYTFTLNGNRNLVANFTTVNYTIAGSLQGANMILTWPANATGYTLQSTTNLAYELGWNTVSPPPLVVNGVNVVVTPLTGPRMFFRLIRQ